MMVRAMIYILILSCLYGCSDQRSNLDKAHDRVLLQFAKQMQNQDLYVIGSGGDCSLNKKINLTSISFDYPGVMNIEDARRLIVESGNSLLNLINTNKGIQEYLEEKPVRIDNLDISIGGQASNVSCDYIAMVLLLKGKIHYYIEVLWKKGRPFIGVHEETFEEAVRIMSQEQECYCDLNH